MLCTKCGANFPDDVKFCPYCGSSVENANGNYQAQPQYRNIPQQPNTVPSKGNGIVSLILGNCSILLCSYYFVGLALGIIGLCLGISSLKKTKAVGMSNGMAIAGIVCSSVGLAINAFIVLWALTMIIILGSGLGI